MTTARLALCLEYDGRPYAGWQSQPAVPTVQTTLEQAIAQFVASDERVEVVAAGRTDTGVDRKSTRLNSSHEWISRMPSSA